MKTARKRKNVKKKAYGSSKIPMKQVSGPWHRLYWSLKPSQAIVIFKLRVMRFGLNLA